jgi:hypothetical protein
MTLALALAVVLGDMPAFPPCQEDEAKNGALTAEALAALKAEFPTAQKASTPCEIPSEPTVLFEEFGVTEGEIEFRVHAWAKWEKNGWVLHPFRDRKALTKVASRISQEPLLQKVKQKSKVTCLAGYNGQTPWFRCSPGALPQFALTPSSGHIKGAHIELEFAQWENSPEPCECSSFPLVNYSLPLAALPNDAPGWCLVREKPAVKKFLAANKVDNVVVARWHKYSVKLHTPGGAQHEEPLTGGKECYCSPPPPCPR